CLEYSNLALHVADYYQRRFKGIGTTLLALCLHLAAYNQKPFLRAVQDISFSPISGQSFYEWHGFRPGDKINRSLRLQRKFEAAGNHRTDDKVFYLNGIFDGEIPFVIPPIGIRLRGQVN
ncbi:MAG: hypothetical protein ABIH69_07535, partial [bacterium]